MSRVLKTARLVLRPHEVEDFEAVRGLWADPDVVRHIYDRPQSDTESWSRLLRYRGHWEMLGFGYWAVTDAATGGFLGEVGFANYRREITPSFDGTPEAGWVMRPEAQGRGLAREAMEAAVSWCDANLEAKRTVAMVLPENAASITLAKALGYAVVRKSLFSGKERLIFERPRP